MEISTLVWIAIILVVAYFGRRLVIYWRKCTKKERERINNNSEKLKKYLRKTVEDKISGEKFFVRYVNPYTYTLLLENKVGETVTDYSPERAKIIGEEISSNKE